MDQITKSVRWILLTNVAAFFLMIWVGMETSIMNFGLFSITSPHFQIHQLITHMFLHGYPAHIIFNMLAFIMFGPICERLLGSTKFCIFYFCSGLFAAILAMSTNWYSDTPMIGASGAVFGILFLFCILNPNSELSLFFIFNVKAKHVAAGLLVYESISGLLSHIGVYQSSTAHFAHVGGALMGLLIGLGIKKRIIK